MPRPIEDQVVVVTGASYGIGRAIVRAFAGRGARGVVLLARNQEALDNAATEVRRAGSEALVCPADVADAEAVESAAAAAVDRFGRIDTWVNSAMATVLSPALEMTVEEFRRVTDVTYHGYVYGTLAALRRMKPRDEGTIIQIGSALAYRSIPLQSAYCGAKAAIRGFTDSIRSELIHDRSNVKITMLQLPGVNTPQFQVARSRMAKHPQPVPPIYSPELIADTVVHAAEHPEREVLVAMGAWKAVVGNMFIPGLLDKYLANKAYAGQQTDELPYDPNRPDNLFETVPGDHGAHGPFVQREQNQDWELWAWLHRGTVAAAVGLTGAAALGLGALIARGSGTRR